MRCWNPAVCESAVQSTTLSRPREGPPSVHAGLILLLNLGCWSIGDVHAAEVPVALEAAGIDLSAVVDRTDLSFEESSSYYSVLAHAGRVSPALLANAARDLRRTRWKRDPRFRAHPESEFPTFVDLIEHPEAYRGQPVTLVGHVIRLVTYPAGPNQEGMDTLYEAWLVTEDSQQHPATIVCTAIPDGLPIGEELIDGVSVTGYFFKLHTYPSRDRKTRFAPMILAHTMSWRPEPSATRSRALPLPFYLGLAVVVAAASSVVCILRGSRRKLRQKRLGESLPGEPPDFLKTLSP